MNIPEAIGAVVAGKNLTVAQAVDVFTCIMSGTATDAQIASLITALRMKGETPEEITGAASVMREKATHVLPEDLEHCVDTCGTGGDSANTFNVSTAAAFIAAGAGAVVAKHGNRAVSSRCGSADVLEALGVKIDLSPEKMKACLDTVGIAFLFAPALHKAMKFAIGPRKEIGVRTIFNILGPLTNPALARHQLLGVFSEKFTLTMAAALNNMGTKRAFVVHGMDGLDEISISGPTGVAEVRDGAVKSYSITPEEFGIQRAPLSAIAGGTPQENAARIRAVLSGEKGPCRDIAVLNAAFALAAAGMAKNPKEGITLAEKSIDTGSAKAKLDRLVEFSSKA
ncbi:MAG: anthranilate phosphoribosyltransferase [Chitinispirillaceae bacterium]|nr:anthranilate phosphoribosyltransferase [Chitinispirillaceae bacterium]